MSAVDFIKKRCRGFSVGRAKAFKESPRSSISSESPNSSVYDLSSDGTMVGNGHLSMVRASNKTKTRSEEIVRYNDPRMQANYETWQRERNNILLDKQTERALVHQRFQSDMVNLCAEYSQKMGDIEDRTTDKLAALTLQQARNAARSQQPLTRKTALLDPKYSYLPPGKRNLIEHPRPRTPVSASPAHITFAQHSQRADHAQTLQHTQYVQQYRYSSQNYPESARTYSDAYYPEPNTSTQSQIVEITDEEYIASSASQNHGIIASGTHTQIQPTSTRQINPRHLKPTVGSPPPAPPISLSSRNLSTKASNVSSWSYHASSQQQLDLAYQHYPRSIVPIQRPHTSMGYSHSAYSQSESTPSEYTATQKSAGRVSRTSRNIRANEFGQKF